MIWAWPVLYSGVPSLAAAQAVAENSPCSGTAPGFEEQQLEPIYFVTCLVCEVCGLWATTSILVGKNILAHRVQYFPWQGDGSEVAPLER